MNPTVELSSTGSSLLPLVKALGGYLTSEEDEQRNKGVLPYLHQIHSSSTYADLIDSGSGSVSGVEFLSSVLARFPPDKLNRQSGTLVS